MANTKRFGVTTSVEYPLSVNGELIAEIHNSFGLSSNQLLSSF